MIDGLSIITGIAITVFLMFYLAFNIDKEHVFLKILTIFAGLFMLTLIPTTTIDLENDCQTFATLDNHTSWNYTYVCYYPNGSQVTNPKDSNIGNNFSNAYLWFLRIFIVYIAVWYAWKMLGYFNFVKKNKYTWRRGDK